MVETISPVVHGGRTRIYWLSVSLHVVGATATAALFGLVVGGLGALVSAPWGGRAAALVVTVAAFVYVVREAFRVRAIPIFDVRSQVPQWWRDFYSAPTSSFLYGVGLGIGFFTYLTYGTYVVVVVAAFASGSPGVAALACGAFGLARSLAVVVATGERTNTATVVDGLDRIGASAAPRVVNVGALAALAATALLSLV